MSFPLGSCCYQGVKHEGQARGQIGTLSDTDHEAYVTEPSKPEVWEGKGILYLTDIVGHKFINAQLLADQFAENGYKVVMPDLFDGDSVPLNADMGKFDLPSWMQGKFGANKRPHLPETVSPVVEAGLKHLIEVCGCSKVAVVGYCFGARYAVRLGADDRIRATYIAHPAMVSREEIISSRAPLAMAAAEIDNIFPLEKRREFIQLLVEGGRTYQMNLYSGVTHGFAVRCDPSKTIEKYSKESAFFLALQWFDEHV